MSGETAKNESAWTIDSLHVHINARIDNLEKRLAERAADSQRAVAEAFTAHEKLTDMQIAAAAKAVDAALASAEKAVSKAEAASEKRFEAVNEFRAQLSDQAALFLPRTEYAANHQNLADRVSELTDRINRTEGQQAGSQVTKGAIVTYLAAAVAVIGLIVAIANGKL